MFSKDPGARDISLLFRPFFSQRFNCSPFPLLELPQIPCHEFPRSLRALVFPFERYHPAASTFLSQGLFHPPLARSLF